MKALSCAFFSAAPPISFAAQSRDYRGRFFCVHVGESCSSSCSYSICWASATKGGHDPPAIILFRRYDGRISRILERELSTSVFGFSQLNYWIATRPVQVTAQLGSDDSRMYSRGAYTTLLMPLVETDRKQDVRRLRSARKQRTVIGDNFRGRFTQLC
jgi:hypothetical protein